MKKYEYQTCIRLPNILKEEIDNIHKFALKSCEPDLTILLDIQAETGIKRALGRNQSDQRFERKGKHFHQRIKDGYLTLAAIYPERIKVIDASQSVQSISDEVNQLIKPMLIDRRHK